MRLLVVGGGSAGHVLPALPVMEAMLARGDEVEFVGTTSGLEEDLVRHLPIRFHAIAAGKLRRYWSWQNLLDVFRIFWGIVQSLLLMLRRKPDAVFSKGGFVSFPVVLAAWLCRRPVVAHESDLTPGLANRLVMPFVRTLCVSFPETHASGRARVVHTGTPLRAQMLEGDAERGRQRLGLAPDQRLLVVTGGSLGADYLNRVVREAAAQLTRSHVVLHVCGEGKVVSNPQLDHLPDYRQVEYVGAGWGDILCAADIVVSRAGANTLFELLSLQKLMLLVPLSAAASRGDQLENAAYARDRGLCAVVLETDLTSASLAQEIATLSARREEISGALQAFEIPQSVPRIVEEILALVSPATAA